MGEPVAASLRVALGVLGELQGAGKSSVSVGAGRCRPQGRSGVGGRWGISAQTLSLTLLKSKNVRLSPTPARRIQVSQSSRRASAPNPACALQRFAHGLLPLPLRGWPPKQRRYKPSAAIHPTPNLQPPRQRRRQEMGVSRGEGAGRGGGGGQRGEGEEPQRQTAARTNPAPPGRSRAEAGPSALQRLRVGGVGYQHPPGLRFRAASAVVVEAAGASSASIPRWPEPWCRARGGKGALRPRAPLLRAVCTGFFRASRRL